VYGIVLAAAATVTTTIAYLFVFSCQPERIDRGNFKVSNFEEHCKLEISIWLPKPEVLVSENMTDIVKILTANPRFSTTVNSKRGSVGDSNNN